MAIESLQNIIFSTETDSWAYRITIWEILTWIDFSYVVILSENNMSEYLHTGLRLPKLNMHNENMYSHLGY